jgi:hypothetical protein
MRWKISMIVLVAGACAQLALVRWNTRRGDLGLWRMRANISKVDTTRPMPPLQHKVDDYISHALGEGTNDLKNVLAYEKKLLAMGRLCQKDFPLSPHSEAKAYDRFWKALSDAAPGAHLFLQGTPGPTIYMTTNVHVIAAVEDMPKVEKLVAQFNSSDPAQVAQQAAPGNSRRSGDLRDF